MEACEEGADVIGGCPYTDTDPPAQMLGYEGRVSSEPNNLLQIVIQLSADSFLLFASPARAHGHTRLFQVSADLFAATDAL